MKTTIDSMRANVFHGPNDIRIEEVPRPSAGVGEAVTGGCIGTVRTGRLGSAMKSAHASAAASGVTIAIATAR